MIVPVFFPVISVNVDMYANMKIIENHLEILNFFLLIIKRIIAQVVMVNNVIATPS